MKSTLAGNTLTNYMNLLMDQVGIGYSTSVANDIKEKLCYVALDYTQELKNYSESSQMDKTYDLPDGETITISKQRFQCPEALFNPALLGHNSIGSFYHLLYHSLYITPIISYLL